MTRARVLWLVLLVSALALGLLPMHPENVERLYVRSVYAPLQRIVTPASNLVPLALLDVALGGIVLGALVLLGVRIRRWRAVRLRRLDAAQVRDESRRGLISRGARAISWTLVAAAVLYLWFLVFWGLNYRRLPLEQKLAYDHSRLTAERVLELGGVAVAQVNLLARSPLADASDEQSLAAALGDVERRFGRTSPPVLARPKLSLASWYFRQAVIDGMTNPFFLEIILNPDLLPFERPFVLAHEWAHIAGYADESEANFMAWLACIHGTPATQYSGWLMAYQHVAAHLPRAERQMLRAALDPRALADLEASRQRVVGSSQRVRTLARGAYDSYLRANRVEEGIASYSAVVRLMLGVRFGEDWKPLTRN